MEAVVETLAKFLRAFHLRGKNPSYLHDPTVHGEIFLLDSSVGNLEKKDAILVAGVMAPIYIGGEAVEIMRNSYCARTVLLFGARLF